MNNCDNNIPIIGKKEKTNAEKLKERLPLNCYFAALFSPNIRTTELIDNGNGTLSIVDILTGTNSPACPWFNSGRLVANVYFTIKKCVQGQVFRQSQNDCKGIGTAANNYGAIKFQWCETNDLSCTKLDSKGKRVIDSTKSPAGKSCATEGFILVTAFYNDFRNPKLREQLLTMLTDAPKTENDYYWTEDPSFIQLSSDIVNYEQSAYRLKNPSNNFNLNSSHYIFCGTEKKYA